MFSGPEREKQGGDKPVKERSREVEIRNVFVKKVERVLPDLFGITIKVN